MIEVLGKAHQKSLVVQTLSILHMVKQTTFGPKLVILTWVKCYVTKNFFYQVMESVLFQGFEISLKLLAKLHTCFPQ
jgi:hypothetical protein